MISPEQRAEIRRLFYAEHWKVGTIASALSVHPDTVRRAIEAERFLAHLARPRPTKVDTFLPFIRETLATYPRLRSTRLFEMLRPRGYTGSQVQLRRAVRRMRPARTEEAYLRLRVMAGEQAQADWGCFGWVGTGRARRPLSCFVMVLSWSRAIHALFTLEAGHAGRLPAPALAQPPPLGPPSVRLSLEPVLSGNPSSAIVA